MSEVTKVYLAGPYSHAKPEMMKAREIDHARCALALKQKGVLVYCPIAETATIAELGGYLGTGWEDWRDHDLWLLSCCTDMYILMIHGWRDSKGVRGELKYALKNNIKVSFCTVDGQVDSSYDPLSMFGVETVDELND